MRKAFATVVIVSRLWLFLPVLWRTPAAPAGLTPVLVVEVCRLGIVVFECRSVRCRLKPLIEDGAEVRVISVPVAPTVKESS